MPLFEKMSTLHAFIWNFPWSKGQKEEEKDSNYSETWYEEGL